MKVKKWIIIIVIICIKITSCSKSENFTVGQKCDYISTLKQDPEKIYEIIQVDRPWEEMLSYFSILSTDSLVHMYYTVLKGNEKFLCYAYSEDGYHWIKPSLNIYEYSGNKQNNILLDGFIDGCCIFEKNGDIYFSAMYKDDKISLYKSKNGIDFTQIESFNVNYYIDSQYQIIYNSITDNFDLYWRGYKKVSHREHYNHSDSIYRTVIFTQTQDIEHFKLFYPDDVFRKSNFPVLSNEFPIVMENAEEKEDYDVYTSCVNYFGNNLYIAFPTLFYHDPDPLQGGKKGNAGECYLSLWLGKNNSFECIKQYLFSPSLMSEKQFYMAPGYFETEKSLTLFFWARDKKHGYPDAKGSYYAITYNKSW